ncbi:MAG: hypothetical protein KF865_02245 [Bdellovibrionaceae bacterium]|nr:hypothetical protein [Pseudobdellovibrionaceae bacterium]
MKRATLLLPLFAAFSLLLEPAQAYVGFRRFHPGEWESRFGAGYFITDRNYDPTGQEKSLPSNSSYSLMEAGANARYVLSPSWSLTGDLALGYAESKALNINRSNSGLTGARLGIEYATGFESFDLIPEFSSYFPMEKVDLNQDKAMISEGVSETLFNMNMQAAFENFVLYGSLGYLMRDEGRSDLAPWGVGFEFPLTNSSLGARLFGHESISNDIDHGDVTSENLRQSTSARVNGGSLKFYGINPSLIATEGYVNFNLSGAFGVSLGAGLTLKGADTAAGYHLQAALIYRFKPRPKSLRPRQENRLSIDPYVDQFVEDTNDGVDQKLFQPTPKPLPKHLLPPLPPEPKNPPPKKRPRRSEVETKRLRQQMNEAEMTIELKADKKSKRRKKY